MKKLRGAFAVMLLLAVTAVPVSAQFTNLFSNTYTGGSTFSTTAAVALDYSFAAGIAIFRLNVTNQGLFGEVYKSIGLINIPGSLNLKTAVGPAPGYTNTPSNWTTPPPTT